MAGWLTTKIANEQRSVFQDRGLSVNFVTLACTLLASFYVIVVAIDFNGARCYLIAVVIVSEV